MVRFRQHTRSVGLLPSDIEFSPEAWSKTHILARLGHLSYDFDYLLTSIHIFLLFSHLLF